MKYKNVKFDLFFMICSLHLLGLPPPKKFKIKQNSRISEAWKLYVERTARSIEIVPRGGPPF